MIIQVVGNHTLARTPGAYVNTDSLKEELAAVALAVELPMVIAFIGLVCVGWPVAGAGELCGFGPATAKKLASLGVCVRLNEVAVLPSGREQDLEALTAEKVAELTLRGLNLPPATRANADTYAEPWLLEYVIRLACVKKEKGWPVYMAVFGLQTLPLIEHSFCMKDEALVDHIWGPAWAAWVSPEHEVSGLDESGTSDRNQVYKLVRRGQRKVRLRSAPPTARQDAESYKNATDLGAGGEDITVGQWLGRRAAARAVTPEDKIRQAVAGLGLYPEWFIVQEGFLDALRGEVKQSLTARELFVLSQRLALDGEPVQKLSDIGAELNLSRETVRLREARALAKLSHPVSLRRTLMPHTLPAPTTLTSSSLGAEPLSVLGLSLRSFNSLRRAGIATVGELRCLSDNELMAFPNLGRTSLVDIKTCLATHAQKVGSYAGDAAQPPSTTQKPTHRGDLDAPIEELGLSPRPRNCLRRIGVATIAELAVFGDEALLVISGFGETSLQEVRTKLNKYLSPSNIWSMCIKSRCQSLGRCVCAPDA